jgi:hypothetical protein
MPPIMKEKRIVEEKAQKLVEMTGKFCQEFLDDDYRQLCEKLIMKMSRKRAVPFLSGHMEIWAAAVVYALGSINFLFDKSFKPYATADDICNYFGTSKSTTSQKAKVVRDMFKMGYFDPEFSTARMREDNPFSNMVMINGLIVDKDSLPQEIQERLKREGG